PKSTQSSMRITLRFLGATRLVSSPSRRRTPLASGLEDRGDRLLGILRSQRFARLPMKRKRPCPSRSGGLLNQESARSLVAVGPWYHESPRAPVGLEDRPVDAA